MSKTGKIGYIGGVSLPPLNADVNSLKAAIASVNPSYTFTPAFAGSFQDPAKGHEIASQMYQGGIDYIQTDSAATDTGIIQAANEGEGRMVSAISPAQYKIGPEDRGGAGRARLSANLSTTKCRKRSGRTSRAAIWPQVSGPA